MSGKYVIGLDYGTNSVRCLIVRVDDGFEVGTSVYNYPHGEAGIILNSSEPDLARQHPIDYLTGAEISVKEAIKKARNGDMNFESDKIIGIGVDTTGSTPIPVDQTGTPLAFLDKFKDNPNAMAWLWKDHTSHEEAGLITKKAKEIRPQYLTKCGGVYSSEWFFAKIWHCLNVDPEVFNAAYTWVECSDYIPAVLTGNTEPSKTKIGVCAAGHKAMFNKEWGGYPDAEYLGSLNPKLAELRARLHNTAYNVKDKAGNLTAEWAEKLGLPIGIPVAVGAFDAHLGAVGSGIKPGTLVKILGTSGCDMMVSPSNQAIADIPGLCGIVDGSILPDFFGLEAGQSAVGDIYNWFVNCIEPGGQSLGSHEVLTEEASKLKPGESGLLMLDWNNGNRTVLVDQRLSGMIVGLSLHTRPEEIYRTLIEATAMGALIIINRFEEYGVKVNDIINCGGIAEKNPVVMQIYADVTGRPMKVSHSSQTCALGAAMAGAVVAGKENGGYDNFESAQKTICRLKEKVYYPNPENHAIYKELFGLYNDMHDAFGINEPGRNLYPVMKKLLEIRDKQRVV